MAIVLSAFLGSTATSSGHARATLSGNMLLASNRSDLALCTDVVIGTAGDIPPQQVAEQVEGVLMNQVRHHPRWHMLGYDQFPIRVEVDCPSEAYLLQPGAQHPIVSGDLPETRVPITDEPSPFRVHLYVVSQEQIQRIFFGTNHRVAPQEMLCEERECFEVTSALYLSPEEVFNQQDLRDGLERVLALNLTEVLPETGQ